MDQPPRRNPLNTRWVWKLAALGGIVIALLIALEMVQGVRRERSHNRFEAVREIEQSWGPSQTLLGPVLRVPVVVEEEVQTKVQDEAGDYRIVISVVPRERIAWLMPTDLNVEVELQPEVRARGIYEAIVYGAEANLKARFEPMETDFANCTEVRWAEAKLVIGLSSGRSLRRIPLVEVNGSSLRVSPGDVLVGWPHTLIADVGELGQDLPSSLDCSIQLEAQGIRDLRVAAVGQSQTVALMGAWPHPSFQGPPLPSNREVTETGFSAQWNLTEFARGWPRFSIDQTVVLNRKHLESTTVGVELMQPVDAYWMVGRSLKYGILFIVMIFTVFLLFEVLGGVRVHPVQYLLVGAALVLFFLIFLALSEIAGVEWGYGLAALAAISLVAFYARSVLRAGGRAWAVTGGLAITYGYLYFVLGSESYALIAGAVALLILLGGVMWVTRRVDWYRLPGFTSNESGSPRAETEVVQG